MSQSSSAHSKSFPSGRSLSSTRQIISIDTQHPGTELVSIDEGQDLVEESSTELRSENKSARACACSSKRENDQGSMKVDRCAHAGQFNSSACRRCIGKGTFRENGQLFKLCGTRPPNLHTHTSSGTATQRIAVSGMVGNDGRQTDSLVGGLPFWDSETQIIFWVCKQPTSKCQRAQSAMAQRDSTYQCEVGAEG